MLAALAAMLTAGSVMAQGPKREFRGAWMHTIFQKQYKDLPADKLQAYLIDQLDKLQAAGMNAVLFQVRPSADAFYPSELEPWSRFLTDGGKAPEPYWDPLDFMIKETHKRGMELHAWLNPYRVTTSKNDVLPQGHIFYKEPGRFVEYGDKKYFDPGLPENRKFITDVVLDIVNRYDVDGIHMDDYFYPYPVAGQEFPDDASYARYGAGMERGDWRRQNVDYLIRDIHNAITTSNKPWVRFGVSPFGIWRNKSSDPRGSDTNGLQNYDALYADVLLWDKNGWVDYTMPQLYWELEHPKASTLVLADWWNNIGLQRHLYFGQDTNNIMKHADVDGSGNPTQLDHKIRISRAADHVQGNCWWPAYTVTANFNGIADSLARNQQSTIALVPEYPWMSTQKPAPIRVAPIRPNETQLRWAQPEQKGEMADVVRFVVYYFPLDTKNINFDDPANILLVTQETSIPVSRPGIYAVTGLNRANRESRPGNPVIFNPNDRYLLQHNKQKN